MTEFDTSDIYCANDQSFSSDRSYSSQMSIGEQFLHGYDLPDDDLEELDARIRNERDAENWNDNVNESVVSWEDAERIGEQFRAKILESRSNAVVEDSIGRLAAKPDGFAVVAVDTLRKIGPSRAVEKTATDALLSTSAPHVYTHEQKRKEHSEELVSQM
jgi:hypothetical protein